MTLGEKIKYIRKQLNLTQDDLHQQTGINLTTIKKYETNRVQPLPPQVNRIAAALDISYVALNGVNDVGFRLQTIGDLIGILMTLINSGVIHLTGRRDANNMLIDDTVFISINPGLRKFLFLLSDASDSDSNLDTIQQLLIKSKPLLHDLLQWEQLNYMCTQLQNVSVGTTPELEALIAERELLELDLQRNSTLLN